MAKIQTIKDKIMRAEWYLADALNDAHRKGYSKDKRMLIAHQLKQIKELRESF